MELFLRVTITVWDKDHKLIFDIMKRKTYYYK
jgi:hypothetical protein